MAFKNYHVDIDDNGVATVLMDRADESMNTLGADFVTELADVVARLEDDDVKAVVIGSAKRDFLAGADIRMFDDFATRDDAIEGVSALHAIYNRIEALHTEHGKPIVLPDRDRTRAHDKT